MRGTPGPASREQSLTLDARRGGRIMVKDYAQDTGSDDVPRDLVAEIEYRDPNGETCDRRGARADLAVALLLGHQGRELGRHRRSA